MRHSQSRRRFLGIVSAALPVAALSTRRVAASGTDVTTAFPTQPPELVQEMVVVAHGNIARVRELIGRRPTLAKAAWDWGFGDWETALGAASHVGHRDIAALLLANGAHPTIFSAAMLGHVEVVKAFVAASPGIQRTHGPHSITLLSHALAGGSAAQGVVEYLRSIEGADDKPSTVPLTDADVEKLSGVYVFGATPADRIEISAVKNQQQLARPGHYGRALFHRGGYEFCPMGAEQVRIAFAELAGGMVITIYDPEVVLTAKKAAA